MKSYTIKSILIFSVLVILGSCKKNEESFKLKSDLLTPLINFSNGAIPDEHAVWKLERVRHSLTARVIASGALKVIQNDDIKLAYNMRNFEVMFAEENMAHNGFSFGVPTSKEFSSWQIINNDEIVIDTLELIPDLMSTYFDVEMFDKLYTDSIQFESLIGTNPYKYDPKWTRILKLAPTGKVQKMKLVMDKYYPSKDGNDEVHNYLEFNFYRIIPNLGVGTTRKKYK